MFSCIRVNFPWSDLTRISAPQALHIILLWCTFRVSWLSSYTPSYLVASRLNFFSTPGATLMVPLICLRWHHLCKNNTASVVSISKTTELLSAHVWLNRAHFSTFILISVIFLPEIYQPTSLTNEMPSTPSTLDSKKGNRHERYIVNRIGYTVDPCGNNSH
jgi:hypothetical protein